MNATPGPHTACVYAINTGPGNNSSLGCWTIQVPDASPYGHFDSLTTAPGSVTAGGWAIDPDTGDPIIVQMYLDGNTNAMTWANQPRGDVGAAFPAAGPNHGFTLTMNATPGPHTACVYAINTGPGNNSSLGCWTLRVP
jgi:hypothetical protein